MEGFTDAEIIVTGGSSKWDPEHSHSISLSDGNVVQGRAETSGHNLENGARDVDIRGRALGRDMTIDKMKYILNKYTGFTRMYKSTEYGHYHLGLDRNVKSNWCTGAEGC